MDTHCPLSPPRTLEQSLVHSTPSPTHPCQSIFRLKLLQKIDRVVDECKSGALASTKLSFEAKRLYLVRRTPVHLGQLLTYLRFGHVRHVWVDDIHNLHRYTNEWECARVSICVSEECGGTGMCA